MIPKLNWNRKNIGKIILYNVFNRLSRPRKKVKNNQFNIKWFLNRFLFSYYELHSLSFIENRLDIILFRTNWFISYNHGNHAILTGKISLNNKIVKNKNIFVKKGDIIKVDEGVLIWKKNGIKKFCTMGGSRYFRTPFHFGMINFSLKYSLRFLTYKNRYRNYMNWFKKRYNFLLKNPVYLEINNNIKTLIVLKNPEYLNIPYPRNLEGNPRIKELMIPQP